jgi:ribonuclease HI
MPPRPHLPPIHNMSSIRIGGHMTFPLPFLARLQTDGSYRFGVGRAAIILTTANMQTTQRRLYEFKDAINSTEMEWASVAKGLEFALESNADSVAIENDNLGVVSTLAMDYTPRQAYAKHYKHIILNLAKQSAWTGVCWIPREQNAADKLFPHRR